MKETGQQTFLAAALQAFARFWHLFRSYGLLSGVTSFSLRDFV